MTRLILLLFTFFIFGCAGNDNFTSERGKLGIYGGEVVGPGSLIKSTVVYIQIEHIDSSGNFVSGACTGVAIDRKHILTSAHCVYKPGASSIEPYVVSDPTEKDPKLYKAVDFKFHPNYKTASKYDRMSVDMAVIKLAEDLPVSVTPALLDEGSFNRKRVFGAGFGQHTIGGDVDGSLRFIEFSGSYWGVDSQIWIEAPQKCTQPGDSGGPLYSINSDNKILVHGILHGGSGEKHVPCYTHTVYTQVSSNLGFIKTAIDSMK